MSSIKILNQDSELTSFPITQSIVLLSDTSVELSRLPTTIVLFRLQTENQLINLAQPYSYTLGYIKETFDIVDLDYTIEQITEGYKITCKPVKPLNLNSKYCIYVSKYLSEQFLNVIKTNSKSNSKIKVSTTGDQVLTRNHTLLIEETSILSPTTNIVKFLFNGVSYLYNLKTKRTVTFQDIVIEFEDIVYVKDELFTIEVIQPNVLNQDFQYTIQTVISSSILPIEKENASTLVSNQSILDYYNSLQSNTIPQNTTVIPRYIDVNTFSIKIPEGYTLNTSDPAFKASINAAFNNYLLINMNLYDKTIKYKVILYLDDFENELIFETIYSTDELQTEVVVIDYTNL